MSFGKHDEKAIGGGQSLSTGRAESFGAGTDDGFDVGQSDEELVVPEPEPDPDPGFYYSFGSTDQADIFTLGTTTLLFDDGADGDTSTDVRQQSAPNATYGIFFGSVQTFDILKIVPGRQGSSAILVNCKYLDADDVWQDLIEDFSPIALTGNQFSYTNAGQQVLDRGSTVSAKGVRIGLDVNGGSPFTWNGCFDLRAFNDVTEIVPA